MIAVEEYLAFINTRPKEERWQLIDGVAMLMPRSTLRHQFLITRLCHVLSEHFRANRLDLIALHRNDLVVPGAERFRPFADVAVLDSSVANDDTPYVDRFYLAAEVLFDNAVQDITAKSLHYVQHPLNLYFLLIEQKEVRVEVRVRAAGWEPTVLARLDAVLELPEWGFRMPLVGLYRGTPPAASARP